MEEVEKNMGSGLDNLQSSLELIHQGLKYWAIDGAPEDKDEQNELHAWLYGAQDLMKAIIADVVKAQ